MMLWVHIMVIKEEKRNEELAQTNPEAGQLPKEGIDNDGFETNPQPINLHIE